MAAVDLTIFPKPQVIVSPGIVMPIGAGAQGPAGTLTIGTITQLPTGSAPTITNAGSAENAVLNFGIPLGAQGPAGSIAIGAVQSVAGNQPAAVTNIGTTQNAVLNFTLPRGLSSTVTIGTVFTLPAGSQPTVANVGTQENAILNFGIPLQADGQRGEPGPPGERGPAFVYGSLSFISDVSDDHLTHWIGRASAGTGTDQPAWTITKSVFTRSGELVSRGVAASAVWDTRETATYVAGIVSTSEIDAGFF
jgi:hypothetical protein